MNKFLRLRLKGKTAVFIDWANVYGWKKSLKKEVNLNKLYKYLKTYKEIKEIYFYFGTDTHPKSKRFITRTKRIGYQVIPKPVKYIIVAEVKGQKIYKRKCDFDMEMAIDAHKLLKKDLVSFVFFTGDGDFEPLYQLLLEHRKQVVVVYASGHIGREVLKLERQIFLCNVKKIISSNYR